MKKIFIFILVALLIPKIVFATTNANGTGTKVDFGGSSGGGESLGDKEYFLRSEHYGIRVSFYSDTGKKLGNSVDVFDYKFNYGKAIDNSFTQVTATDKYARYHAVLKSNGDLKSRIDYINEYKGYTGKMKDFIETDPKSNYINT